MVFADIKIRSFLGENFKEFIPCIARLRLESYRDYPYLYHADLEKEKKQLKKYSENTDTIAILVFEGGTVVGASIGVSLIHTEKELQRPFLEKYLDPNTFYYFDVSFLLKKYRGRGLGHHFFDLRESHAKTIQGIKKTCFYSVERADHPSLVPSDYLPKHHFWRNRGYTHHPDICHQATWQDIGHQDSKEKMLTCWIKEI